MAQIDVIVRILGEDNPPDFRMDSNPAINKNQKGDKEFQTVELEPLSHEDVVVQKDFISTDSKPVYPTLSKVLGYEVTKKI